MLKEIYRRPKSGQLYWTDIVFSPNMDRAILDYYLKYSKDGRLRSNLCFNDCSFYQQGVYTELFAMIGYDFEWSNHPLSLIFELENTRNFLGHQLEKEADAFFIAFLGMDLGCVLAAERPDWSMPEGGKPLLPQKQAL